MKKYDKSGGERVRVTLRDGLKREAKSKSLTLHETTMKQAEAAIRRLKKDRREGR